MILNAVLCDYLRLTTFEHRDSEKFSDVFHSVTSGVKKTVTKRMQYEGFTTPHAFNGMGKQKRQAHYFTEYNGQLAHLAYVDLLDSVLINTRCTRIDVQLTIPLPDDYDSRTIFDHYKNDLPHARSCTLLQSPGGFDTIYFGSRKTKNGRFTRLYVKEYVGGLALRFETESKGEWANEYWTYLRTGGVLSEILVSELESLGNTEISPIATFYSLVKGYLPAPRPSAVETSNPTLDWLLNTCEPVIVRMLNDHDHGWKVRRWLENLLDWT